MSRNVLKQRDAHTYFDDLESFYYVFCWLIASFDAAGIPKAELPKELTWWDREQDFSYAMKGGHMGLKFLLPVSPWFGQAIPALAKSLHDFFRFRWEPIHDPVGDYNDFLSCIRTAIAHLESEVADGTNESVLLAPHPNGSVLSKRNREASNDEESDADNPRARAPPRPAWLRVKHRPSYARPRRANANYCEAGDMTANVIRR